jgi:hypothetical protein
LASARCAGVIGNFFTFFDDDGGMALRTKRTRRSSVQKKLTFGQTIQGARRWEKIEHGLVDGGDCMTILGRRPLA